MTPASTTATTDRLRKRGMHRRLGDRNWDAAIYVSRVADLTILAASRFRSCRCPPRRGASSQLQEQVARTGVHSFPAAFNARWTVASGSNSVCGASAKGTAPHDAYHFAARSSFASISMATPPTSAAACKHRRGRGQEQVPSQPLSLNRAGDGTGTELVLRNPTWSGVPLSHLRHATLSSLPR